MSDYFGFDDDPAVPSANEQFLDGLQEQMARAEAIYEEGMEIAAGAQVEQPGEPGGGVPSGTESTLKLIDAIAGDAGRIARGELSDDEVAEITEDNRIRAAQMEGYVAGEEIRQSVREVEQDRRDRNAEHEARTAADQAAVETDALIAHTRRVLGVE